MTHLPPSPSRHRLAVLAAAFGLALLTMPVAHAFTFEGQSNTSNDGAARYHRSRSALLGDGPATTSTGQHTIQFGGQTRPATSATIPIRCSTNGRPGDGR